MLHIHHIAKTFNPGLITEKTALVDVELHLKPGDFATVIGGNGAGKSTMLNAVAGVFPVDKGSIEIDGVNVTHLPEYKRAKYLGRVFQDPILGELACFFNDPTDVGNLISGSSAFSKSSLNIWKFGEF